ncbi:MAG: LamB/YcsF family protein [Ornithinimicrobium sp.]|uniref:LamB/YcsF family protein n=1 Tax=Ornithinimicrobium sp. TaxID=1977084 RepID=UPI0017EAD70F|nr:LamB/YcsF family protein [Actinomycetota bacterium]
MDLNSDLGESFGTWRLGDDEAMLDLVTSANVACGFHAGDALTLQRTCAAAAQRGVVVGAQVSYRDLAGFGRRYIAMDPAELTADVLYQLGALEAMCRVAGTRVGYVKPHGALYHAVAEHEDQAAALVAAVTAYDPSLPVMGLPGAASLRLAEQAGLRTVTEAFADRGYTAQGRLVPRGQAGALLHDPEEVAERMVRLATEGRIKADDGSDVEVRAQSICTHGDSPGAVAMARAVREALTGAGVEIAPFIRTGPADPDSGRR